MCGHTVNYARGGFGVNKPSWQNWKLEFCDWVFEGFADKFFALETAFYIDFSFLFFEFLCGFLADYPAFAVNGGFHVGGVRVYPHVCYAVDGFRTESGSWQNGTVCRVCILLVCILRG